MKTHPESIFTRKSNLADLDDGGTCDLWSSRELLPEYEMTVEFVPASAYNDIKERCETVEYSANGYEALYESEHQELGDLKARVENAMLTIERFGGVDGEHHRA